MQLIPFFAPEDPSKPYDFCEKLCPFRNAKKCNGPNYLCAGFSRFVELCMLRKDVLRKSDPKWTNAYIAEKADVSITTINRFFAGGMTDIKFTTASQIVNALSDELPAQHPCPMESITKILKENGLEQLLEDFEAKKAECETLRNTLENTTSNMQSQIDFLKSQIDAKDRQIVEKNKQMDERAAYMVRKDNAVKWLGRFLLVSSILFVAALISIIVLVLKMKNANLI